MPDEFHHRMEVLAGGGLLRKQRRQGAGQVASPLGFLALGDVT
jgi:hypothetical protein